MTSILALAPQTSIILAFGGIIVVFVFILSFKAIGKQELDRKFILGVIGLLLGLFGGGGIGTLIGENSANNSASSVKSQVQTVATQAERAASSAAEKATDNHAERALRSAVIYRKLSLGSQSEQGERRIERLLSAHTTCRLQRRSLFAYLSELFAARARGDPAPLLA